MFTKTKIALAAALVLGLGGAAMANDSGENHQDGGNSVGSNPFMPEFSTRASSGSSAFGSYPVQQRVVHHHVKK